MSGQPCWEIVHADGSSLDDDYIPHYDTEAEALKSLAADDWNPDGYKVIRRAQVCHTIQCDICGEEGDSGANHFDATQVPCVIKDLGWTPIPVGTGALCDMCCDVEIAREVITEACVAQMEPMF